MALKTINDLTALTTPASTDLVGVWAVGATWLRKSTIAQTFSPMLAVANVFSAKQTMDALLALKKNVAPGTTSGYLELGTDSNGDLKVQNDAGAARTLAGSISGGGTVATGGYTLTAPATGTAALLAAANVFTAQNKFEDRIGFLTNGSLTSGIAGRSLSAFADSGLQHIATLFGVAEPNGLLIVHNANTANIGLFSLRGGLNTVDELLDVSSAFSIIIGTSGSNVVYQGGYYLENKTGGACNYNLWLLT